HHEKTPSFMVSADRQIYHCFGCGAGGNAFNFLIQYERLEFREAVEMLAKKVGVELPSDNLHNARAASLSTAIYKVNEFAAFYYQNNLNLPVAQAAKSYLLKRGLKEDTIKLLKLGFALNAWDGLINFLRQKNVNLSFIEKAGLALAKDSGGYYDRFRNRIIFPIFDARERAIAFGGRVLDESLPKYMNSPETACYIKGKHLYGLHLSKEAIRQNDLAVVVEGYLDFIMPYQEGVQNIVASLGTALTYDQIRLLKRYTENVVMIYDPDEAGQTATLRSLDMFIEEGVNVKVATLPDGLDPDTFVRKNGIGAFKQAIDSALKLFDYKLKVLSLRYDPTEAEGKAKICSEMLPTINRFSDAVLKSEYLKALAEALKIKEEALFEELKKIKPDSLYAVTAVKNDAPGFKAHPAEKLLMRLMLEESELISRVKENIGPDDFQDKNISKVVSVMFELSQQGKQLEISNLVNYLEDQNVNQFICESAFEPELSASDKERIIEDCVKRLKTEKIRSQRQNLHEQIKAAQHLGDEVKLNCLMQEFNELIKKEVK
ncbi:MAG: DNA primase, partial [Candidatus Omnitrophota bacterium]